MSTHTTTTGRRCGRWPVAFCTWSLRMPITETLAAAAPLGLDRMNLGLRPALADGGDAYLEAVGRSRLSISATTVGFPQEDYTSLESIRATGGIVPDAHWPENRRRMERAVAITAELGVPFLSFHAGFLEEDDAARAARVEGRLVELADLAGARGLVLLLETGQETAACLAALLERLGHPALGVNFDPANMILYGKGDPVAAVGRLGPWIRHVHVKDAVRTRQPGTWGTEVPWGEGDVGAAAFLAALATAGYAGTLAIEREGGENRLGDIHLAAERLAEAGRRFDAGDHP